MRRAPELFVAVAIVVAVTVLYWLVVLPADAAPGALVGHGLGIVGFALMLVTEIAYSVRKNARDRAWGPMRTWLRAHVVTGIVGPYLVLLHTSWLAGGLAGATMIATVVVVLSGFVGRYLYTAIPRTPDGAEATLDELDRRLAQFDRSLELDGPSESRDRGGVAAERDRLARSLGRARTARKWLAIWHTVHVPLGAAMFTLAFIHIGFALYFTVR